MLLAVFLHVGHYTDPLASPESILAWTGGGALAGLAAVTLRSLVVTWLRRRRGSVGDESTDFETSSKASRPRGS
jgi:hypothetical protein